MNAAFRIPDDEPDTSGALSPAVVMLVLPDELLDRWAAFACPGDVWAVSVRHVEAAKAVFGVRAPERLVAEESLLTTLGVVELVEWFQEMQEGAEPTVHAMAHDEIESLMTSSAVWSAHDLLARARPVPPPPHRRATRVRTSGGVAAVLNGSPAALVDLSALGGRVLVPSRSSQPGQHVSLMLKLRGSVLQVAGRVVWMGETGDRRNPFQLGLMFDGDVPPELAEYLARLSGDVSFDEPQTGATAAAPPPAEAAHRCPACRSAVERDPSSTKDADLWWCASCSMTWGFCV